MNNYLNEKIETLKVDEKIITKLKNNNILTINDLWAYTRKNLKGIGLLDSEIKKILIVLELNGLELNKKLNGKDATYKF